MAEIRWTKAQEAAIEARGSNILVSAAAGSGKTAVLVERVMRLITDEKDPADIDSLLIMTFTRAAAAQMKEKIYRAIRRLLSEDPKNDHLNRQLHKVHNARIYTIDALCMEIVRDNFQAVDIDPGFRVADESELAILRADTLAELIEEQYQDPSDEFIQFVNFYIDKSDSKLEEIILQFFKFAQSHPEPERWIRQSVRPYKKAYIYAGAEEDISPEEEQQQEDIWLSIVADNINRELADIKTLAEDALDICEMDHGPYKYSDSFIRVIDLIKEISAEDGTYDFRGGTLREFIEETGSLARISKKDDVDPVLKETASSMNAEIKKRLASLRDRYFSKDLEQMYLDMADCASVSGVIADLTIEFGRRFLSAKKEKNIADFSDVAHYALDILLEKDEHGFIKRDADGTVCCSDIADRMARDITEIIVDEYQDTNLIQEYIIKALSCERFGRPDVFMVGDVKQSIYGFRMACPELFLDKYNSYPVYEVEADTDISGRKILLNSNFRSRKEVLDLCDLIFEQVMIPEVGGIDYLDGHGFECASSYPEDEEAPERFVPEILFMEGSGDAGRTEEAYHIALKIENLVRYGKVTDAATGCLRNITYSDIAILTRNTDNPQLEQMLEARKIPVIHSSGKGFFDTFEIRLIINLLEITDNPYQDIPFTAVLTSPLAGLSSNEIAVIRTKSAGSGSIYEGCRKYAEENNDRTGDTLRGFLARLSDYRDKSRILSSSQLIDHIMKDSNADAVITAMPQGDLRLANIEFLKDRAAASDKGTYSGLHHFITYIKQMKDQELDFGQAQILSDGASAVQMMTVHKSKGLEFPVVILAGTGKQYNEQDIRSNIILDRNIGLGLERRDPEERTVARTLLMEAVRSEKMRELYAEEIRLLYVGLTRAKEKLIITGTLKGIESACLKWSRELLRKKGPDGNIRMSAGSVLSGNSFIKTAGRALMRSRDAKVLRELSGIEGMNGLNIISGCHVADIEVSDALQTEEIRADELITRAEFLSDMEKYIDSKPDISEGNSLDEQLSYIYPYEEDTHKPVKITASQLEDHSGDDIYDHIKIREKKRLFAYDEDESGLRSSDIGNAYHRLLELIDHSKVNCLHQGSDSIITEVKEQIEYLTSCGLLSKEYASVIDAFKVAAFLTSDTGRRMKRAAEGHTLRREQQFVMSLEDGRLVQGIIDAFFEEEGGIVLVDYKTDRYKSDEEFIKTYKGQLETYAAAIEAAVHLKVREKIIFSIEQGRGIRL